MPIVKWLIPIIGKLADNRPILIIGRYRLSADKRCTVQYRVAQKKWNMHVLSGSSNLAVF